MYIFDILTLFPESLEPYATSSILGRAQKSKKISIEFLNFREYGIGKHKQVDDSPFGGGVGMVLKPEPLFEAVAAIKKKRAKRKLHIVIMSPRGRVFTQKVAREFASKYDNLILIAGRYEGFDERIVENIADEEISIGNYVLSGGELPAMVIAEAVSRNIPGVLGKDESAHDESHSEEGVLEYPQYTKPADYNGMKVPPVLLSGNHAEIKKWREAHKKRAK